MALPTAQSGLALLLLVAFLDRCSPLSASPTFWGVHCSLGFALTAAHIALSGNLILLHIISTPAFEIWVEALIAS